MVAVAHGYSGFAPLKAGDFSGGRQTVAKLLRKLEFEVVEVSPQRVPIVLVSNERTAGGKYDHWIDITGERYQYPNKYKNKVVEGRPFIYYRGSRRADGSRKSPEYFGHGIIGAVHVDPDTDQSVDKRGDWKWYCEIQDYWPFEENVPLKQNDGQYYEQIPENQWFAGGGSSSRDR